MRWSVPGRGLVLLTVVALVLAPGCVDVLDDGRDGEEGSGEGTVEDCEGHTFAGSQGEAAWIECEASGDGETSQQAACAKPEKAELTVQTDLDRGSVLVLVEDDQGQRLAEERVEDTGDQPRNLTVASDGASSGTWTLTVERSSSFEGAFQAELWCPS